MPRKGAEHLAGRDIPQHERFVFATGERGAAVGGERDRVDGRRVPREGADGPRRTRFGCG